METVSTNVDVDVMMKGLKNKYEKNINALLSFFLFPASQNFAALWNFIYDSFNLTWLLVGESLLCKKLQIKKVKLVTGHHLFLTWLTIYKTFDRQDY